MTGNDATANTDRSRWAALVVLCVGMLMIVLDMTVVNVALPYIQEDLGFSQSSLAWVVNAYLIAFGGLLLLAGRLGDLISRRGVFLVGLGVFTVASVLCGVAGSQELLVGARFLQGIGGAMTSAVILGMIVTMIPRITAEVIAPPAPWMNRAATRTSWLWASPQTSDAAVKIVNPIRKIRRRPIRSPSRPERSSRPPKAIR